MTNLTELIEQWIGEEKEPKVFSTEEGRLLNAVFGHDKIYSPHEINGYNQAIKDLKSKIPDLIEQIEKEYEGRLKAMYEQGKTDIFMTKQL